MAKLKPHPAPSNAAPSLGAEKPHVRLSDAAMQPFMASVSVRIKADPSFRRDLLRQAGIIDTKGKITKAFGG